MADLDQIFLLLWGPYISKSSGQWNDLCMWIVRYGLHPSRSKTPRPLYAHQLLVYDDGSSQ